MIPTVNESICLKMTELKGNYSSKNYSYNKPFQLKLNFSKLDKNYIFNRRWLNYSTSIRIKNGHTYLLIPNLNYFYANYPSMHLYALCDVKRLSFFILLTLSECGKKNCVLKIFAVPHKKLDISANTTIEFNLLVFPDIKLNYGVKSLTVLKKATSNNTDCIINLTNKIIDKYELLYDCEKIVLNNNLKHSNEILLGYTTKDKLFFLNNFESASPFVKKIVQRLTKLNHKRDNAFNFPYHSIAFKDNLFEIGKIENCFIIDETLTMSVIKSINGLRIHFNKYSPVFLILLFLIQDEMTPKTNSCKYHPIPYGWEIEAVKSYN